MAAWAGPGLTIRMARGPGNQESPSLSKEQLLRSFSMVQIRSFLFFYKYRRIYMKAIAGSAGYASAYLAYPVAPPLAGNMILLPPFPSILIYISLQFSAKLIFSCG